jgi:hypothetical protein
LPAAVLYYVPADHLAQFVVALAREHLDVLEIVASCKSGLGQPPFDPRMMPALLLYSYCSGLYSSRRFSARPARDVSPSRCPAAGGADDKARRGWWRALGPDWIGVLVRQSDEREFPARGP